MGLNRFRGTEKEEGLRLAGQELADRGFAPTNLILALETVVVVGQERREAPAGVGFASTTVSNSSGEVIIPSWDDGDDSTWEGVIYVEDYSTGEWATYAGQLDISTPAYSANWATRTGPLNQQGHWSEGQPEMDRLSGFALAVARERGRVVHAPSREPGAAALASSGLVMFRDFAWCSVSWCAICAELCLLSGPYWGVCFGGCCVGGVITCAIYHLL